MSNLHRHPMKDLPPGYTRIGGIDLRESPKLNWILQIVTLVLFVIFGFAFVQLTLAMRPELIEETFSLPLLTSLIGVLVAMIIVLILHEAVHGIFFWYFIRARPHFGVGPGYAYAGAPDWYLPRNQHMVVGLAPLVVITVMGMALVLVVPPLVAWMVVLCVTFNASGAAGDIGVVGWCLTQSPAILVQDTGMAIALYGPGTAQAENGKVDNSGL